MYSIALSLSLFMLAFDISNVCGFKVPNNKIHLRGLSERSLNVHHNQGYSGRAFERGTLRNFMSAEDSPTTGNNELLAAVGLVGGTTVGAGILALPTFASVSGFLPSTLGLIAAWAYMCSTGVLVAEVAANSHRATRTGGNAEAAEGSGYLANVQRTLGGQGGDGFIAIITLAYLFVHYALIVAYTSEGGRLLVEILGSAASIPEVTHIPGATLAGSVGYTSLICGLLFFGSEAAVDTANVAFCGALLVTFLTLVSIGLPYTSVENALSYQNYPGVLACVPIFLLALVFQNICPTVARKLDFDPNRTRLAIVGGSAVPLVMFLLWDYVCMGMQASGRVASAAPGVDPVLSLFDSVKGQMTLPVDLNIVVAGFSLLAITTSFIGFVFALVEFWSDAAKKQASSAEQVDDMRSASPNGLPESASRSRRNALSPDGDANATLGPLALTIIPGFVVGQLNPDLFLNALDLAGAFGISVLFGIVPPLMALQAEKSFEFESPAAAAGAEVGLDKREVSSPPVGYQPWLPGGTPLRAAIAVGGVAVIIEKCSQLFSA
jgi:tyrosine-specific transport protein